MIVDILILNSSVVYCVANNNNSFCSRQPMIPATATVHSPLISHTWLFQETYMYGWISLNPVCYNLNIWSVFEVYICLQSMAEQLAENYHNTWGRKKKLELQAKGDFLFFSGWNLDMQEMRDVVFPHFLQEFWLWFCLCRRWNTSSAGALWYSDSKGKGTR